MPLNASFFKLNRLPILLALTSLLLYGSFAYDLIRSDHIKLVSLYAGLFFLFYKLIQFTKHDLNFLTWIAFGFRAIFILALPNLSQDFYRFIWDGRLILEGINPYLFTPDSYILKGEFPIEQAQELYDGMGSLSAGHFSNYPPINQLCFVLASLFSSKSILGSVVILRLIIIAADFGTLHFGKKLLRELNISEHNIFWYILNPFIIIELTGNLHFEGLMIFFLVWSLYLIHVRKWFWAAFVFAISISVKLIPLLFLPLLVQKLGWKKSLGFYTIVGLMTILLFIPFYSDALVNNYAETIGLWFQNFEFNASLYYLAREIGYWFRGWNEIATIGKIIPILVVAFVLILTFFRKNKTTISIITAFLFALSFYFFIATTVHPWYIATLILLSVFTNYKFPTVWSLVIVLSYLAYRSDGTSENLWIILLEYIFVYGVLIWEVFIKPTNWRSQHHQAI